MVKGGVEFTERRRLPSKNEEPTDRAAGHQLVWLSRFVFLGGRIRANS